MSGRDVANSPFASSACCFPYTGWSLGGSAHPPSPQASPYPFHCSHRAPWRSGQIAYVCREALKVAGPRRTAHTPHPQEQGRQPKQAPVCVGVGWGGVGGVPQAELPEGLWVRRGRGSQPYCQKQAPFPFGSVTPVWGEGWRKLLGWGAPGPEGVQAEGDTG